MKIKGRAVRLIAAFVVFCCILSYLPAAATQTEIDNVKDNIDKLEQEQNKNQQELENLESDKAYLTGQLAELNRELEIVVRELTNLKTQLKEKEEAIRLNTEELIAARQREKEQYENMKKRIRFLYERGETDVLELILEARSFADFINIGTYVSSVYNYDRDMLNVYRSTKEEIAKREETLVAEQQELVTLTQQQQDKMGQVETLLAQVRKNINNTNQQISGTQQEIAENKILLQKQREYEAQLEAKKAEEDAKRMEEIKKMEEELGTHITEYTEHDIAVLAAIIECEAVGESYEGQMAVGSVVMNRVRSPRFPNTVVEVIYQPGQFSPVASGRFATVLSRGAAESCVRAAIETLSGNITNNCLFFRRNNGTINGLVIGNHVFY